MKLKNILPICVALSSCSVFAKDRVIPSSAQSSKAVLGKGYDSVKEMFVGDCVQGDILYAGAPEASVSFERSLSAEETADSLGFSIGGRARYGVVKASAAARFASDSSSSEFSEATVYSAEYQFKNAKMKSFALTSVGQKAFGTGSFTGENWDLTCGHEYVEQIQLGAKIFISAKVEFATKEDKQSFAAEFKIKGPAFSASGELHKASRRYGKTAAVTIRAYQLGGDVSRLSSIFGSGNNAKVELDGKKVHALLVCSMDKIDACTQVLDNALVYATDTLDPSSFPNQIKPNYDPTRADGPAELSYITKPWSALAFYPQPPIMTALIKEARVELSRSFESLLALRNRINALNSGAFRLSPRQKYNIDQVDRNLSSNLALIMDAVEMCYTDAEKCPAHVQEMKNKFIDSSRISLEVYPEIFAQWCDAADSGVIKKAARETVKRLVDLASEDMDLTKFLDKCGEAERVLKDRKFIDIGSYHSWANPIQSLEPLRSLPQIEILWAPHNQIESVEALRELTELRELILNRNQIKDLSSLSNLKKLERVRVSFNKIRSLPNDLTQWSQLKEFEISNNSIRDISSLKDLKSLMKLYIGGNEILSVKSLEELSELECLDLSFNKIKDFSSIENLGHLIELDVDGNEAFCPSKLAEQCLKMEL